MSDGETRRCEDWPRCKVMYFRTMWWDWRTGVTKMGWVIE